MADGNGLLGSITSFTTPNDPLTRPMVAPPNPQQIAPLAPSRTPVIPSKSDMKKQSISQASDAKKAAISGKTPASAADMLNFGLNTQAPYAALPSDQNLDRQIVGVDEELPVYADSFEADIGNLTLPEMVEKYGPNVMARIADSARAERELDRKRDIDRDPLTAATDLGLGFVSGAGRMVEGIANLGRIPADALGLDGTPATAVNSILARVGNSISEGARSLKSQELADVQYYAGLEKSTRSEDIIRRQAEDRAAGDSRLVAGLKRIGRETASAIEAGVENPATVGDMVAESAADLVVSSVGGAGIARAAISKTLAARGVSAKAIDRFLSTDAGKAAIHKTNIALQPAMAGAQEAGGAASEAGAAVDAMSHEDLLQNSAEYREHIKTKTPEQAKRLIRQAVVLNSAAASGLSGLALGAIGRRFDAAPLMSGPGLTGTAGAVVGETLEEAGQGLVGQTAQNLAIQAHADNTQDVLEGVGTAVGEGALAGGVLAGTLQGPGAATAATIQTARGAGRAVAKGAGAVNKALSARLADQIEADDPNNPEAMAAKTEAADTAVAAIIQPEVTSETTGEVTDETTGETTPQADSKADLISKKIIETYEIPEDEHPQIDAKAVELIGGEIPKRRSDMILKLAEKFENTTDTLEKDILAAEINENLTIISTFNDDETSAFVGSLDDADPRKEAFSGVQSFAGELAKIKGVVAASEYLKSKEIQSTSITEENASTPESQQEAKVIASVAGMDPLKVDPSVGQQVLDLAKKRKIQLPESAVKAIQSAIDISSVAKLYSDSIAEIRGTQKSREGYKADDVTDQILEIGWQTSDGTKTSKKSIVAHATDIQEKLKRGSVKDASFQMETLTNFAQTQLYKLDALDRSSKEGTGQSYDFYDPDSGEWLNSSIREGKGAVENYGNPLLRFHPKAEGSHTLYKKIFAETSAAVAVQNSLATKYPELGIKPLEMPKMSISIARRHGILTGNLGKMAASVPTTRHNRPMATRGGKDGKAPKVLTPTMERTLRKEAGGQKPLTAMIAAMGGVKATSPLGKELRAMGLTPKSNPKLFVASGGIGLDNIPASEHPYLAQFIGEDDNGYLNQNNLLEALKTEASGTGVRVTQEQQDAWDELEARLEEQARLDKGENTEESEEDLEEEGDEEITLIEPYEDGDAKPPVKKVTAQEPVSGGNAATTGTPTASSQPPAKPEGETEEADATDPTDSTEEEEETEDDSEEDTRTLTLAERFGKLFNGLFAKWFKSIPQSRSILALSENPLDDLTAAMEKLPASSGKGLIESKFVSLVPSIVKNANHRMNKLLNGGSLDKSIADGKDITKFPNVKGIIFTHKDEDGKDVFDKRIIETAAIAAVSAITDLSVKNKIDVQDALSRQGIQFDGVPSNELLAFYRDFEPHFQLRGKIAQDTMRMLGIKPDENISEGDTRAAFEAVADEILAILRHKKVIEHGSNDFFFTGIGNKTLSGFKLDTNYLTEKERKDVAKYSDMIRMAVMPDAEPLYYIGEPPTEAQIKKTQKATGLPLSRLQKAAVEAQTKIPFSLNMPFLRVADFMGQEAMMKMRGYIEITDEMRSTYNVNDLNSIEGKNQSILSEIENTQAAIERMVEVHDGDPADAKMFFNYEVNSVGRTQAVGNASGQSNKYARAALRSTWATLDLSGDNPSHMEGFLRTVVQMSGVKINKKKLEYLQPSEIIEGGLAAIEARYPNTLKNLEAFFSGSPDVDQEAMADELQGTEPVVLETLSSVARYNILKRGVKIDGEPNTTLKSFRHSVPLEADGVTNGPANVLMKFSTGAFTPKEIEQWERIGFFFSPEEKAKALADKSVDGDTYSITAQKAVALKNQRKEELVNAKFGRTEEAVSRFFSKYNPLGVKINEENVNGAIAHIWELDRNAAKNPLTKTTYGAGKMGTARGITNEALEKFYGNLSAFLQSGSNLNLFESSEYGYPGIFKDLEILTGKVVKYENFKWRSSPAENSKIYGLNSGKNNQHDFSKFTLNPGAFEALAQNVNTVYVDPLYQAVESTMGSSFSTMKAVIEASKIQSLVLRKIFDIFLSKYDNNQVPSPKEIKDFMKKFRRLGAYIETPDQSFMVGKTDDAYYTYQHEVKEGKRKGDIVTKNKILSQPIGREWGVGFRGSMPGLAGVSAGAYINIGTGDGLMMSVALAAKDIPGLDRVLQIYDGLEMPADQIASVGSLANKAAYTAWQTDTMQDILSSFENFARNLNDSNDLVEEFLKDEQAQLEILDGIYPYVAKRLWKTEGRPAFLDDYPVDLKGAISNVLNGDKKHIGLRKIAAQTKVRLKTLSEHSTWTDQMAGANQPYHNKGRNAGTTATEIAANLNARARSLAEANSPKALRRSTDAVNVKLNEAIESQSETVAGTNIKSVPLTLLPKLFKLMSVQSQMYYKNIIKSEIPADLQVYYGTADELEAFKHTLVSQPSRHLSETAGQYHPTEGILFLVQDETGENLIGEAIVHELTHVAIADKIVSYLDKGHLDLTDEQIEAADRLHDLAHEFSLLNFSNESKAIQDRMNELNALRDSNGETTSAFINEVITEILTNPEISRIAKQQKIPAALRIIKSVLKAIRSLFPNLKTSPNNDYFHNAMFNVEILTKLPTTPMDPEPMSGSGNTPESTVLNKTKPTNSRTKATGASIRGAVNQVLQAKSLGSPSFVKSVGGVVDDRVAITFDQFLKAGFTFNPEETMTFYQIMSLFLVDAKINGPALVRAQEIFDKVMSDISVESFMENEALNDPSDRLQAQYKFNALTGQTMVMHKDFKNRSLILPSFLALAASSSDLQAVLEKLAPPGQTKTTDPRDSVDEALANVTDLALDTLTRLIVGENKGSTAQAAVENLLGKLADFEVEKQTAAEKLYQNTYNTFENKATEYMQHGVNKGIELIDAQFAKKPNPFIAAPLGVAKFALAGLSERHADAHAEFITKFMNQKGLFNPIRELFAELRGRSPSNAKIYDMIKQVRFAVSTTREHFREKYPDILQEKFSRKLTKAEWSALHKGIGQTDLAVLKRSMDHKQISRLFNSDGYRKGEITKLSANLSPKQLALANGLADYMVNGNTIPDMRRNAYAISIEGRSKEGKPRASENDIDRLVTIMAIDKMNVDNRKTVAGLFNTEPEGIKFALAQMAYFRDVEYSKHQFEPIVRINQWKGYIPSETGVGVEVILADNSDHDKLAKMGYTKVGSYGGATADYQGSGMSYYRTNVSSRNPYTQGVAQTVQSSQNGIDIRTGRSVNGISAGVIAGNYAKTVKHRLEQNPHTAKNEHLLPVFSGSGVVIAYERAIRPEIMALKNRDTHFGKMMGAMGGRQVEEAQARFFNQQLVKNVKEVYDNDFRNHEDYVNLATSKDPIHMDTWKNVIPRDMKDDLAKVFGPDNFPVRRDMIPMVVGYRNPGVSDLWTGVSRIPEETRKAITKTLVNTFGRKTYAAMVGSSRVWTGAVSELKTLIVVKSVVVPAFNLASNILQLSMHGVPMRTVLTQGPKKLVEINKYLENEDARMRIEAEIRSTDNPIEVDKLKVKLDNLDSSNKRMSIWPLIESGQFATISEGLTEMDASVREGRFFEWVEEQVEKLPDGVRTLGRYGVVSKTTTLYKGLNRATQYGDFLAKAILYDELTTNRKLNHVEATAYVTQDFVNYDVPPGRSMAFLESHGLLWFPRYKIGSVKAALRMLRENPLRSFMGGLAAEQFSFLGSPVSDNLASTIIDGRFENSVGLEMGLRAMSLNPWVNVST